MCLPTIPSNINDFYCIVRTGSHKNPMRTIFLYVIAGATEIPATKLFGRAPAGMNATGESDLRNYYDTVRQNQEAVLRPILEKLYPVICLSAWGAVPDDLDFEFNPIRDTSDEERASLIQQTASAINSVFQSGIISQQTALKELRQAGASFGMWTNITDEDIENAADQPQGGEEEGGEEGAPGEEGGEEGVSMEALLQGLAGQAEESPEQKTATQDAAWKKEDHPQGKGGKFVQKGGGSGESAAAKEESGEAWRTSNASGGVKVSKQEYARLTSHVMQYATPEQRKEPIMTTEMGGMIYTLEKDEDYNILRTQIASANWTPRMNKICSASAGLAFHTASTAGAVKDAEGKAQPIP